MLTKYGRKVRSYRNEYGMRLKDMADRLDVSSAYLSAMETGAKSVPDSLIPKIGQLFDLDAKEIEALRALASQSAKELRISLSKRSNQSKELASVFARKFPNMRDVDMKELMRILKKVPDKET